MIDIIKNALEEDIGKGDITTNLIVPKSLKVKAIILVKEEGIIAGLPFAEKVFKTLDKKILFKRKIKEGAKVKKGTIVAEIEGNARAILIGERTALNILQKLSGIATLTSKFVKSAGKVKILDTRKTTPGLRVL